MDGDKEELLQAVLRRLKLPLSDVDEALLVGSWLWDTATVGSDFDVVVIMAAPLEKQSRSLGGRVFRGQAVDVVLIGRREFEAQAREDFLFRVYSCIGHRSADGRGGDHPCLLYASPEARSRLAIEAASMRTPRKKQQPHAQRGARHRGKNANVGASGGDPPPEEERGGALLVRAWQGLGRGRGSGLGGGLRAWERIRGYGEDWGLG